jgi:hypothetical protein
LELDDVRRVAKRVVRRLYPAEEARRWWALRSFGAQACAGKQRRANSRDILSCPFVFIYISGYPFIFNISFYGDRPLAGDFLFV